MKGHRCADAPGHDCSAHAALADAFRGRLTPKARAALERVCGYLDGELDARTRRFVERHLAACRPCQSFLRAMRGTVRALHAAPRPRLPDRLREALRRRLRPSR